MMAPTTFSFANRRMSQELPHASLQCLNCDAMFRVTLKKGRVPSKPIPCPKCKNPVTVRESDIVHPGTKTASPRDFKPQLRQTKPGDTLAEAKFKTTDDPTTAEVPVDPPTAEVPIDGDSAADASPAFGIIQKRKVRKRPSDAQSRGPTPLGVNVARPDGKGRRDNVFGQKSTSSVAIGRIATMKVKALDEAPLDLDVSVPPSAAERVEPAPTPKKLDLSRLKRLMQKLETESDPEDDEFKNPLRDFDLDLPIDDLLSESDHLLDDDLLFAASSDADQDPEVEDPAVEDAGAASDSDDDPEVVASVEESDPKWEIDSKPSNREMEPSLGVLGIADSDAYELGEAPVPERIADAPEGRGQGGIVFGVVMLLVIAVAAYLVLTPG